MISPISIGLCHFMCITQNNELYVWGNNNYGLGDTLARYFFTTLLTLPNNEKITHITCGENHSIALTENKNCFVWRRNYGQLGLDDRKDRSSPTLLQKVIGFKQGDYFISITSGGDHNIGITHDKKCYVWGNTDRKTDISFHLFLLFTERNITLYLYLSLIYLIRQFYYD